MEHLTRSISAVAQFGRIEEIRRFEGGLGAIANTEPAQKRGHMDFGRCLGDVVHQRDTLPGPVITISRGMRRRP